MMDVLAGVVFTAVAIVMMGLGYLFIDWVLRKVDLQAGVEKDNKAAAIVSAAIFLGIAGVVATVFNGVLR
jgi:uncharacterized membrane protein YjfL (UPF0719 family)